MIVTLLVVTVILFIIVVTLKIILIIALVQREKKLEKFTKDVESRFKQHSDIIKDLKK